MDYNFRESEEQMSINDFKSEQLMNESYESLKNSPKQCFSNNLDSQNNEFIAILQSMRQNESIKISSFNFHLQFIREEIFSLPPSSLEVNPSSTNLSSSKNFSGLLNDEEKQEVVNLSEVQRVQHTQRKIIERLKPIKSYNSLSMSSSNSTYHSTRRSNSSGEVIGRNSQYIE